MYGAPRQEVVLFNGVGVQVTSARFICGHQTYPVSNITSVAPFTVHPSKTGIVLGIVFSVGLVLLGLLMMAVAAAAESGAAAGLGFMFLVLGLMIVGACIYFSRLMKPTHGVSITTSGMNVRALTSPDLALVNGVLSALNQALSMR